MTLDEIIESFEFLDDWDDRYRYLIEIGRSLDPLPEAAHTDANKVRGCASQVWLQTTISRNADGVPVLNFLGDSDAHIVRGLVALTLAYFSGHTAKEIIAADAPALFRRLGFEQHLTPQRSNGLRSMVDRIKRDAAAALAAA
ncbi:cysteine desufuration protein SufE [Rhodoblastus sphagnicola]|uniref:Cysteine desufuration protein SufE n=1 Tax=Rhodoblastus sphagnicola TaxID=333368 RepID=A0A2S6NDX6_9HYPH|nr:SufE family protein [Rhodoblastus sphagnicola]MBB4198441.1 cysteine desulfuration protein SufE [Rhodoblastus sphagnicola]PPQ32832.1 cysteine desufuration protein SufE [Rhodoblastus sphagnicola]